MADPASITSSVVIVGGGITGLAAAWRLHRANVPFVVLEASARWGGKVRTDHVEGYTLELGADAFLLRKPWARKLATELDLEDRIQPVNRPPVSTYVLNNGKPVPLPDGLALLVPSKIGPFLRSPLFSVRGKARVLMEPWVKARRDGGDETLAAFITRRLGPEMLEKVAEPMLAGVFNGEADRQSMQATFPQFPALEREHGSLLRGIRAKRKEALAPDERPFFSFKNGAQELTDAIVAELWYEGATTDDQTRAGGPCHRSLRLNAPVARIDRAKEDGLRVVMTSGELIRASAVLLATPASFTAGAIERIAPDAARSLREIRYTGIGTAYVAYRRQDVPHALDGYGVVIPKRERRLIDGMTFSTTKWDGRAPEGHVLIRIFFGGPHTREAIDLDDQTLLANVRRELSETLGITAEPLLWHAHRWPDGYPQYDLGHLDRVATIEANLPAGVHVAGSAYRGVGVPDCVRQGTEAAERIIASIVKEPAA